MRKLRFARFSIVTTLVAINLQACGAIQQLIQGSPTPTLTPTSTPRPTSTHTPTVTPNLAATEQYETFLPLVEEYFDKGYIASVNGTYQRVDDYSDSLAEISNYRWSTIGVEVRNFIIKTHVTMTTANKISSTTGCGIVFRTFGDYTDFVFLEQSGRAFYATNNNMFTGGLFGRVTNPAEFDFVLVVNEKNIRFYVNGKESLVYETFLETYEGDLGFAVVSGSNEDYGSRCEFKDTELWIVKDN